MQADEDAIRSLVALWHTATAEGQVEAVLDLMAEEVVFLVAGQPPMRGRTAFEKGLRAILETHRIESSGDIQELRVAGDQAYCWSQLTVRMTPLAGGQTMTRSGPTLSVLRKESDGRWRMWRDANLLAGPA